MYLKIAESLKKAWLLGKVQVPFGVHVHLTRENSPLIKNSWFRASHGSEHIFLFFLIKESGTLFLLKWVPPSHTHTLISLLILYLCLLITFVFFLNFQSFLLVAFSTAFLPCLVHGRKHYWQQRWTSTETSTDIWRVSLSPYPRNVSVCIL